MESPKPEKTTMTFTLPSSLVDRMAQEIDGRRFRNRTHLIEMAIEAYLEWLSEQKKAG